MVTENLVSDIYRTLANTGQLLIQSNCEDVAVHLMDTAKQVGFKPLMFNDAAAVTINSFDGYNIPKRALDWQASGERALGDNWCSLPLLPEYGRTETEVSCILDRKPVHRCILMP